MSERKSLYFYLGEEAERHPEVGHGIRDLIHAVKIETDPKLLARIERDGFTTEYPKL